MMKNSVNIMINVTHYYFFILAFLVLSCSEKNQNDRNISGKDSANIKSLTGENNDDEAGGIKKPGKTYNERLAEHTYEKYCAVCHGIEGKGDGFNSYNLDPHPTDFTNIEYMNVLSYEHLVQAISEGGRGINKSPLMPAWGNTLTSDDVHRLATYVSNFDSILQE